ncbi:MAG: 3-phosphoglycerate dehydrogenase family protein [Lentisphaeria bacterium]
MKKILIPTKLDAIAEETLKANGYDVVQDSDSDLMTCCLNNPDTEAMIVRSNKITPEIIDVLPKLKVIVRAGAGYNTIDIKYARRKGIDVMNTPGANANGVAEEVIGMALASYRHFIKADADTRAGGWSKKLFMSREITGKTIGIVGLGHIGQLVAEHVSGFNMKIIAYDPIVCAAKAEQFGAKLVDLKYLFANADIITMHIPENDETRGIVNKDLLSLVKKGCMLINCARSGIINEEDLRALKAEKELIYCNDVYAADKPGVKSCADIADIMLPHLGANTEEANFNAAQRAATQIIEYFKQGITTFVVNKDIPDGLNVKFQQLAYKLALVARSIIGKDAHVSRLLCSFYGDLNKYGKWFIAPICKALSDNFEQQQSPEEAMGLLKDLGINLEIRDVDSNKRYGNAITIDLETGTNKVSLRGTIIENTLVISRIDEFDHIYFIPQGNVLLVSYADGPGMLACITSVCAKAGINIENINAPRDPEAKKAISILLTDKLVSEEAVKKIKKELNAEKAVSLFIP